MRALDVELDDLDLVNKQKKWVDGEMRTVRGVHTLSQRWKCISIYCADGKCKLTRGCGKSSRMATLRPLHCVRECRALQPGSALSAAKPPCSQSVFCLSHPFALFHLSVPQATLRIQGQRGVGRAGDPSPLRIPMPHLAWPRKSKRVRCVSPAIPVVHPAFP